MRLRALNTILVSAIWISNSRLHSTNPIERLYNEVKRRADVADIFPNEASIIRIIGAVLFEQIDEWQTISRYMQVKAFKQIDQEEADPHSQHLNSSRPTMTPGHPIYTILEDVVVQAGHISNPFW